MRGPPSLSSDKRKHIGFRVVCVCGKSPSFNKNLGFRSWVILPLVSLTRGRMFLSQIFLDHTFWGTPHVIARTNTFSIETPVLFPPSLVCVFITTVPSTKLFAWGEGDSGGHVKGDSGGHVNYEVRRAEPCAD
jgi:hypothetical protein